MTGDLKKVVLAYSGEFDGSVTAGNRNPRAFDSTGECESPNIARFLRANHG